MAYTSFKTIDHDDLILTYRFPCRVLDSDGNVVRTITPGEQIEILHEWMKRYMNYGWTKNGTMIDRL
jgi:hypothetical protein